MTKTYCYPPTIYRKCSCGETAFGWTDVTVKQLGAAKFDGRTVQYKCRNCGSTRTFKPRG